MLSPKQKKLVNIAWRELEGFIKDWLRSPNEWLDERDIQVEIASRIKRRYKEKGQDTIWAKYTDKRYGEKILKQGITMGRVACEPPTYYRPRRGRHEAYRPDIVIWSDITHPEKPYEKHYLQKRNDHMLWVCEIKYRPPWKPTYYSADKRDLDKLQKLLKQKDGTKFACCLNIAYKVNDAVRDEYSYKPRIMGRLRVYNITLPKQDRCGSMGLGNR